MNNLILKATSNRLEIEKETYTTGGSINFDCCIFRFDQTWSGFSKTAVFGFGTSDYARVELQDDECKIPSICLQEEGILKIAVYGVNEDGVVITTNAIAHRVNEGIGEVNNWYEEDNLFVYNAMKELETSLDKYKSSLDTRFNELLKMLRRKGSISDSDVLPGEPDEWYTPGMFTGNANIQYGSGSEKYQAYLDYILNVLVIDFPEYVSSEQIGYDASEEFPIYAYTFEPLNYEKTVLITGNTHSENDITLISLSYFLDDLCRNFKEDRTLSYLRSKVKLVVVPVVNPYGFVNKSRLNANGVDLYRNFPYKWNECVSEVKGDSPADQNEVLSVFEVIYKIYEDKFCAALDLNAGDIYYCGKMVFYPRFRPSCISAIAETLDRYNYENEDDDVLNKTILVPSVNPSISNFLADAMKINTCSVLWSPQRYTGNGTAGKVTKYAELIGNLLYSLAENSSITRNEKKLPFINHYSWRSLGEADVYSIGTQEEKVPITSFELKVAKPCCMNLTGYAIIKASAPCNIRLNPVLWQDKSPEQSYNERLAMNEFSIDIPVSQGVHVLPIETVLQAYLSDTNTMRKTVYPEKVKFSLVAKADAEASAGVIGYSFTLRAFESDVAKPIEISRPMGLATDYNSEDDVPTQEIIYPLETVTERDADYDD